MTAFVSLLLLLLISISVRALGNSFEVNERRLRWDSDAILAVLVGRNALGRKLYIVSLGDEVSTNMDSYKTISATHKSSEGGAIEPIKFNISSLDLDFLLSRWGSDSNDAIHVTIPSSVGWQMIAAYVEWRMELENIEESELHSDVEVMILPRTEFEILKRGWQDPSGPFSVRLFIRKKIWAGGQDFRRRRSKTGAQPVVEKGACDSLVRQLHEYLTSLQLVLGKATKTWTNCGFLTEVSTVVSLRCITDFWLYGSFPWLFDTTTSVLTMALTKAWKTYSSLPPPLLLLRQLLKEPLFLLAVLFFACFLLPYISNQPKKKQAKDRQQQQQRIAMKIRSLNVQTAAGAGGCPRLGGDMSPIAFRLQRWWLAAIDLCKRSYTNSLWSNLKSSMTLCWRRAVGAVAFLTTACLQCWTHHHEHHHHPNIRHLHPHNKVMQQQPILPLQDQVLEHQKLRRAEKRSRRNSAPQAATSDPIFACHQPPSHSPKSPKLTPSDPRMLDVTDVLVKPERAPFQFSEDSVRNTLEQYYGSSDAVVHVSSSSRQPQQQQQQQQQQPQEQQGYREALGSGRRQPIALKPVFFPSSSSSSSAAAAAAAAAVTVSTSPAASHPHHNSHRHAAGLYRQFKKHNNEHNEASPGRNHHHESKRSRSGPSAAAIDPPDARSGPGDLVSYFSWSSGANGGGGGGGANSGGGGGGSKGMFGAGVIGDSGCGSRAESDVSHASSGLCDHESAMSSSSSNGDSGGSGFSLWTAFRVVTIEALSADESTPLSTDEPCPAPPRGSSPSGPIAPQPRYGDSNSSAASSPLPAMLACGTGSGSGSGTTVVSPSPLGVSSPSTPMSPPSPPQPIPIDGHEHGYMYGTNGNDISFSLWNPFGTSAYGLPADVASTQQLYSTALYCTVPPVKNTSKVSGPAMYGTASGQMVYASCPSYQPITASQAAHDLYCNWYGYGCGYGYEYVNGYGYGYGCVDGGVGSGIPYGTASYMYGNMSDVHSAYESPTIWANGPLRGFVHELPGAQQAWDDWSAAAT